MLHQRLGANRPGRQNRLAPGLDPGQQATLIMAVCLRAIDRARLHAARAQHGADCLPLAEMTRDDDRTTSLCMRLFERGKTGARDGKVILKRLEFRAMIDLEQGAPHFGAHASAHLDAL